jgi:hypothetical protein
VQRLDGSLTGSTRVDKRRWLSTRALAGIVWVRPRGQPDGQAKRLAAKRSLTAFGRDGAATRWVKLLLVASVTVTAAFAGVIADAGAAAAVPKGSSDRVVIRGRATLDGVPFDATYIGAVVKGHGLVTPCQLALPDVRNGQYEITVYARTEAAGCGQPGAEIFLWTFVQDQIIFSSESVRWPGNGAAATFIPTFSIASPSGGVGPIMGLAGEVLDRHRRRQPPGTRVEAYIGTTRCAVASIRRTGNFTGFSIDVVGPHSVPGCSLGGTITFRVNGRRALETSLNEPGRGASLNLSLA